MSNEQKAAIRHKPVRVRGNVVTCDWIAHRGCDRPLIAMQDADDRTEHVMCPACGAFLCCGDPRWLVTRAA